MGIALSLPLTRSAAQVMRHLPELTDTMTLREAATALGLRRPNSVRELLELDTENGRRAAHAGFDALGRTLVRASAVRTLAEERAQRGNWRGKNLDEWQRPSPRDANGKRLCMAKACHARIEGRVRYCGRHARLATRRRRPRP